MNFGTIHSICILESLNVCGPRGMGLGTAARTKSSTKARPSGGGLRVGALIIRTRLGALCYCTYQKEPQKPDFDY